MVEPYPDRPDTHGEPVFTPKPSTRLRSSPTGLQVSVHGDGAVADLDDKPRSTPTAAATAAIRSTHQTITDADIPRFAALSVVTSAGARAGRAVPPMQVIFSDQQVRNAYPATLPVRATLAFGTDWPIMPVDPMMTFAAAMFPPAPTTAGRTSG